MKEVTEFSNELNTKHVSIKFEFKFSRQQIEFLETLTDIDSYNQLKAILYKKPTDRQN